MSCNCPHCGKEFSEFDQRGFRNAGFTAHQNNCFQKQKAQREGISRATQRAPSSTTPRMILPAVMVSGPPTTLTPSAFDDQLPPRGRRHSENSGVPLQWNAPASSIPSPPSIPAHQTGPTTFLNFSSASDNITTGTTTTAISSSFMPSQHTFLSAFNMNYTRPYYNYNQPQQLFAATEPPPIDAISSVPANSLTPIADPMLPTGTTSMHPMMHLPDQTITMQEHPVPHPPVLSSPPTNLLPTSSTSSFYQYNSTSLPAHQQIPSSETINYPMLYPQHQQQQQQGFTHRSSLPTNLSGHHWFSHNYNNDGPVTTMELSPQQQQRQPIDTFSYQHCNCAPNGNVHDANCSIFHYCYSEPSTSSTTRAPLSPSSSAPN